MRIKSSAQSIPQLEAMTPNQTNMERGENVVRSGPHRLQPSASEPSSKRMATRKVEHRRMGDDDRSEETHAS